MLIGYARVSTDDQNLDLQRDALDKTGCEKIYLITHKPQLISKACPAWVVF